MNFIARRYKEENDLLSIPILLLSLCMIIIFSYYVEVLYSTGSIWTFLPVCGIINSIIIFYGVSSLPKPKNLLKGHYDTKDFYKMLNPIKKVPFVIEYPIGLISVTFIPQLLMSILIASGDSKIFYQQNLLFFLGYILVTGLYAIIRFKYFPFAENKLIKNHEIINFFENFNGGKEIKDSYVNKLKQMSDHDGNYNDRYKNDFSKGSILKEFKKVEKEIKFKSEIEILTENLVKPENE